MARSRLFGELLRTLRIARACDDQKISTREGIARAAKAEEQRRVSRRELLGGAGAVVATAAFGRVLGACSSPATGTEPVGTAKGRIGGAPCVAIVGAGLAGLVCADHLQKQGIIATLYEANPDRVGGRCYSNRKFAGHVGENGGEMIDNGGKVMLAYANEFKLALEDYNKEPGETVFFFEGKSYANADVVDQWRVLVARAKADVKTLSAQPTALKHTDADVALDNVSLQTWLDTRCADLPLLKAMLTAAYISEYGRDPSEQSCLNLLLFVRLDRRSKFNPYGASDERYHIVGGNDQVPMRIRDRLEGDVVMGHALSGLSKSSTGEYTLTFKGGITATADLVVIAIPFSVLRGVALDASLGLPAEKINAIQKLGYGYNGKTEVLFNGRPWAKYGSDGAVYADLENLQNTWETNWTTGGDGSTSILTDYFGGTLGYQRQTLHAPGAPGGGNCGSCHTGAPSAATAQKLDVVNAQAELFLTDLDAVFPGAKAQAVRTIDGKPAVHRAHWLPQSYSKGSYTCYLPGQFTSIAGWEGASVGNLLFAGEHADSFYDWQGYLEGAARSGVAAAVEILGNHGGAK